MDHVTSGYEHPFMHQIEHDKGLANVVICDPSREFLNAIMYCDFKLMVRLSLFFLGNKSCKRFMPDVLHWWILFVKRFVTSSSISAMRSSSTMMLRLLASK